MTWKQLDTEVWCNYCPTDGCKHCHNKTCMFDLIPVAEEYYRLIRERDQLRQILREPEDYHMPVRQGKRELELLNNEINKLYDILYK